VETYLWNVELLFGFIMVNVKSSSILLLDVDKILTITWGQKSLEYQTNFFKIFWNNIVQV